MRQKKEIKQDKAATKRDGKGRFTKGNDIGEETRFEKENKVACKYKDEYCERLLDFFMKPATRTEYKETYMKGELTSRTPVVVAEEYPTFEMFAADLGVTTDTLRNWCDNHPRFRFYYTRAKEIQLGKLTSCALMGLYNPLYAKFEAVNNHGQKDKSEVEASGSVLGVDDKTLAMIERVAQRQKDGGNGEKKE